MTPEVIVYSQPGCPPCQTAKDFLKKNNIPFVEKDVTEDFDAVNEMMEMGSQSTPTIKYGDKVMVGFRADELLSWFPRKT